MVPGTPNKQAFLAKDADGFVRRDVLLVPQATMAASLKKGASPQYHSAINKEIGKALYEQLCAEFAAQLAALDDEADFKSGTYGNRQALKMVSSGPNTFIIDWPLKKK